MESQSSELRGEGVPPSPQSIAAQCRYVGPGGHHCRALAGDSGSGLCPHHARVEMVEEPVISEATANALLAGIDRFATPAEVTFFLGNLAKQVIGQRVGRRDAVTLTYICQLILHSQSAIIRDKERLQAIEAKKPRNLQVIWDIPGPDRSSTDGDDKADDEADDEAADQEG